MRPEIRSLLDGGRFRTLCNSECNAKKNTTTKMPIVNIVTTDIGPYPAGSSSAFSSIG
jgi:hypothetical protein